MKALTVVLGLAVAGCVAGCTAAAQVTHHSPNAHPGTRTTQRTHAGSKAPLSATVVLPSRTMAAGSSMAGHVVIENNTGHAIHAAGCGSLFQVDLVSGSYHPTIAWLSCYQAFTIPTGRSSYRITVTATHNSCTRHFPHPGITRCLPEGPPPLPAGDYRAELFQSRNLVPTPPAIPVHVTSR